MSLDALLTSDLAPRAVYWPWRWYASLPEAAHMALVRVSPSNRAGGSDGSGSGGSGGSDSGGGSGSSSGGKSVGNSRLSYNKQTRQNTRQTQPVSYCEDPIDGIAVVESDMQTRAHMHAHMHTYMHTYSGTGLSTSTTITALVGHFANATSTTNATGTMHLSLTLQLPPMPPTLINGVTTTPMSVVTVNATYELAVLDGVGPNAGRSAASAPAAVELDVGGVSSHGQVHIPLPNVTPGDALRVTVHLSSTATR
jgi:hypothetical protein